MIMALAAVLLSAPASAAPAFMPLPGYTSNAARSEEFPPNAKLIGEVEDPLAPEY